MTTPAKVVTGFKSPGEIICTPANVISVSKSPTSTETNTDHTMLNMMVLANTSYTIAEDCKFF